MSVNWKDPDAYPHPGTTNPAQWAWEFLRRNPAYRTEHRLFVGGKYGAQTSERDIAKKYGINRMMDPGRPEAWRSLSWDTSRMSVIGPFGPGPVSIEFSSLDELWVKFNLSRPFETNVKRARSVLRLFHDMFRSRYPELVIGNKRDRFDKYRTYLQLLDAEEAGASHDEMAAALFPDPPNVDPDYAGTDKVRKALGRARELRDGGYLDLLL